MIRDNQPVESSAVRKAGRDSEEEHTGCQIVYMGANDFRTAIRAQTKPVRAEALTRARGRGE
jgi:hypothetical protein